MISEKCTLPKLVSSIAANSHETIQTYSVYVPQNKSE
jgi:hypothetical protein